MHKHAHRVPTGLRARASRAAREPGRLRLGGRRALCGLSAMQGVQAPGGGVSAARTIEERVAGLDWEAIEESLWQWGWAVTPPLLTESECGELIDLWADESRFRSRIDM